MSDLQNYVPGLGRGVTVGTQDVNQNLAQYISVQVTSAQLLALNSTPVQIIASPGSGNAIVVTDVTLDVSAGTAYGGGGTLSLYYGLGTTQFIAGGVGTAVLFGTLGSTVYFAPNSANTYQVQAGTSVYFGQQSATAWVTGNETVNVNVWYAVIPTGH